MGSDSLSVNVRLCSVLQVPFFRTGNYRLASSVSGSRNIRRCWKAKIYAPSNQEMVLALITEENPVAQSIVNRAALLYGDEAVTGPVVSDYFLEALDLGGRFQYAPGTGGRDGVSYHVSFSTESCTGEISWANPWQEAWRRLDQSLIAIAKDLLRTNKSPVIVDAVNHWSQCRALD